MSDFKISVCSTADLPESYIKENELGVKCVGAAIRDYTGKAVAAISVSGPAQRMTPKVLETIGGEVQKITREISQEMGYSGHSR